MWAKLIYFIVPFFLDLSSAVRVCPTWVDYETDTCNERCYESNDPDLNTTELVQKYCGATVEEYYVTTDDGYILLLQRAYKCKTSNSPILLGHGVATNSKGFVTAGINSLVCDLLEENEVWLVNFRGTIYSRNHTVYKECELNYWLFSFHEMGIYDLRAIVDFIYEKEGKPILYIGYSITSTVGLVYQSTYPLEAAVKLVGNIFLAPVGTLQHTVRSVVAQFADVYPLVEPFINTFWHGVIWRRNDDLNTLTANSTEGMLLWETFVSVIMGEDLAGVEPISKPNINWGNPDNLSAKMVSHYFQWIRCKTTCQYDYGPAQNLVIYGCTEAPCYDFRKVPVPTTLFLGANDWASEMPNALVLYEALSANKAQCGLTIIADPKFNHIDFMHHVNRKAIVNTPVLAAIATIRSGQCGCFATNATTIANITTSVTTTTKTTTTTKKPYCWLCL